MSNPWGEAENLLVTTHRSVMAKRGKAWEDTLSFEGYVSTT